MPGIAWEYFISVLLAVKIDDACIYEFTAETIGILSVKSWPIIKVLEPKEVLFGLKKKTSKTGRIILELYKAEMFSGRSGGTPATSIWVVGEVSEVDDSGGGGCKCYDRWGS